MSVINSTTSVTAEKQQAEEKLPPHKSGARRIVGYLTVKLVTTALTLLIGIFLAVMAINYGGFIDSIFEDRIRTAQMALGFSMADATLEEKTEASAALERSLRRAYRLDEPFLLRTLEFTWRGLTFDWRTEAGSVADNGESNEALAAILEGLPYTLLLLGASIPLMFFASVYVALFVSRRYGSRLDRFFVFLSPISAVPNWIHGVLLTVVFAGLLRWLPFGGTRGEFPPANRWEAALILGRHMILPVSAILLSTFFQSVYAWRTFFLIGRNEDYVEVAVAKGLPDRLVQRRYILRPVLPYLLTSFALLVIGFWQSVIALELFFDWPGIGKLFITAIERTDREVLLGLVVMFAYLLALSTFLLDIVYALVDPRVALSIGSEKQGKVVTDQKWWRRLTFWSWPRQNNWGLRSLASWRRALIGSRPIPRLLGWWRQSWRRLRSLLQEIGRYRTAVIGSVIILLLIAVSIYTVVDIPYETAVQIWRGERQDVYQNPRLAAPAWTNYFRFDKLPQTITLNSAAGTAVKETEMLDEEVQDVQYIYTFDYPYDVPPREMVLLFDNSYREKRPYVELSWVTPDGREIELNDFSLDTSDFHYYLNLDDELKTSLDTNDIFTTLFYPPDATPPTAATRRGRYQLKMNALLFEPDANLDMEMILYGRVHGPFGTDHQRRDLTVAMLWGAPVALAFGLVGAFGTSLLTMLIAAVGAWFGGWVDELVQRLTDINLIIPALPIAIMVYYVYAKSIWLILGVLVLLNIFGSMLKNYRSVFIQVKRSPYVEAAQAYGAGSGRIVLHYLVPRIVPVLVPQLVIMIPGFVFLEATLGFLGVSDIYLPSWGKVLYEGLTLGAFNGRYYWVLQPIALLLITGFSFAVVGFALDRVLNPRLRSS